MVGSLFELIVHQNHTCHMIKWKNHDISLLETSHLSNLVKWIDRERLNTERIQYVQAHYEHCFASLYQLYWVTMQNVCMELLRYRRENPATSFDFPVETFIYDAFAGIAAKEKLFRKGGWMTKQEKMQELRDSFAESAQNILDEYHGGGDYRDEGDDGHYYPDDLMDDDYWSYH
jgi:hypothetical protein